MAAPRRWWRRGDILRAQLEADRARAIEQVDATTEPAPGPWLATKIGTVLMVHMTDDSTIRGVLVLACEAGGVLLGAPEFLGDKAMQLGGEVHIPGDKISFVQVPPAVAPG